MLAVSYTMFNRYFIEKRVAMMGLAQTLLGLGSMGFPLFVDKLMSKYGFRGCMAIIAALNGHALFGMLVMHPVEWHIRTADLHLIGICYYDEMKQYDELLIVL